MLKDSRTKAEMIDNGNDRYRMLLYFITGMLVYSIIIKIQ
jgi:hypothetical protein